MSDSEIEVLVREGTADKWEGRADDCGRVYRALLRLTEQSAGLREEIERLREALAGLLFQDSTITEEEKLARYLNARWLVEGPDIEAEAGSAP